jgi:hypothetical protein
MRTILVMLLAIVTFVIIPALDAQEIPEQMIPGQRPGLAGRGMANYVFTQRGDLPIYVSVWGAVRFGGRYEIPDGTDLGQLLSLAGGPGADVRGFIVGVDFYGRQSQGRGKTHIRVSRNMGGMNEVVLESRIDGLLKDNLRNFRLRDGDVIMIDQVQRFNIWDAMSIVSISASILLLLDRIFVIF